MTTLWDIMEIAIGPRRRPPPSNGSNGAARPHANGRARPVVVLAPVRPVRPAPPARAAPPGRPATMRERYEEVTRRMLAEHGVRVRKWRTSMSGVAWQVYYKDGTVSRLIEAPRPRGPMSAAVFLHEIGHHAIGFGVYRPRCLEEYHAWKWSLEQMERHGLNVTDAVRNRMRESLVYAIEKGQRRGLRAVPPELARYLATTERPSARSA